MINTAIEYLNQIGLLGYATALFAIIAYSISFYKLIYILKDVIVDSILVKLNLFLKYSIVLNFKKSYDDLFILKLSRKYYNYLNISQQISKILPLFGIIGTINGMITLFLSINNIGDLDSSLIAKGISQALLSTQFALIATVPLIILNAIIEALANSKISLLEILLNEKSNEKF